jgi:hypothetical protein
MNKNNTVNIPPNIVILIGFAIIFFIVYSMVKKESPKDDINSEKTDKETKEKMMDLSLLSELKVPEKEEITKLPKTKKEIFLKYGNNNNYILNDGRKIYQNCTRYLENTAIIDGYRFGLARLEWHKSVLSWNGNKIGLELHVVHSDVESQDTVIFIFPLSLVDMRREFFTDLSYYNMPTDVATLNSLLTRTDQIPSYFCCTPNRGAMVNFNLCPVANLILLQKEFYEFKMNNKITWLIASPQPYDRTIGLNIRSKLVG